MNPLQQTERLVLKQSQEWALAQLMAELQSQANQVEMICPKSGERLSNTRWRKMKLRVVVGTICLRVRVGYSQKKRRWLNPIRLQWGLKPYQQVSPELEARVCQTATLVPTYHGAVEAAACWGCAISDDLIHRHVQDLGCKAGGLVLPPDKPAAQEAGFSFVIMMDGWMARERGPNWGAPRRKKLPDRVLYHEIKSAVIYRLEQAVKTAGGRGLLLEKHVVATPPETGPVDFGARVQAEALRRGLGRAKRVYVVMDGAVWIWHLARERFSKATLILDFHHAREHLMAVAQALHGDDSAAVHAWVDPLLDQLLKGKEARVISQLEELQQDATLDTPKEKVVDRETRYFEEHREHLHYQRWKRSGVPRGSGAVESLGLQLQRRFRTCGQFWKRAGLTHLLNLAVIFKNGDQSFLWN
jgi:hypothetical protein